MINTTGKSKETRLQFSVSSILENIPDLEQMDAPSLKTYLEDLEEALDRLNLSEPRNERSEEYDVWAEEHEDLEDLIDEILDLLDE